MQLHTFCMFCSVLCGSVCVCFCVHIHAGSWRPPSPYSSPAGGSINGRKIIKPPIQPFSTLSPTHVCIGVGMVKTSPIFSGCTRVRHPLEIKKANIHKHTHTRTNEKSVENMYIRSCPTRKITVIGRGGVAPAPAELLGARGSEPGERKNKSGKNVYMSTMKMCVPFGYHRVHKAHLPPPCAHLIIVARRK